MTSSSAASRKALSKIACNRLQKELVEWQVNPPAGFKQKVTDNLQRWVIEVHGAPGTLYANETFQLQVDFPEHYPMEAPQVIFLHPAPLHPHIYSNGHICLEQDRAMLSLVHLGISHPTSSACEAKSLSGNGSLQREWNLLLKLLLEEFFMFVSIIISDILYDSWSPAMTVSSICISILSMLSSSTVKQPPEDNDRYVRNCKNGRSPKETRWWFHDDKV